MNYQELAIKQGVSRPFELLDRMGEASRAVIGKWLGIDLSELRDPAGQSWKILNCDLKGLQARTHLLTEKLSPFARNNNWWEIVTRTANWLHIPYYPGLSEKEIESLIFFNVSERVIGALQPLELAELDRRVNAAVDLRESLQTIGLSQNGIRFIFLGRNDASVAPRPLFPSITQGLSLMMQRLRQVYTQWFSLTEAKRVFRTNQWCLAATLCALYLYSLVEENLEEFELVRG